MGSKPRNSTAPAADPAAEAARISRLTDLLATRWPDAVCEVDHQDAYQLLVGTVLAAQSTDKMINSITPALFARWPDATALAGADPGELEPMIFKSGFYRQKARSLLAIARAVVEQHGGRIPDTMAGLTSLHGVARKTANVVLSTAFKKAEGVVVDTHVTRLAVRLGLTAHTDPVKIEADLMAKLPHAQWGPFADRLIWHGRRVCFARKPECGQCELAPLCPSAEIPGAAAPAKPPASKKSAARRAGAQKAAARQAAATPASARKSAAKQPAAKQPAARKAAAGKAAAAAKATSRRPAPRKAAAR